MWSRLASVLFVLFAALAAARAEPRTFSSGERPALLLELFTSEGCSSCPPAEEWIGQLETHRDLWRTIVPVVFHVDYWDGLGWPDRYAAAEFTARQRRYAAAWGSGSVYTPGFVAAGREWKGFFLRQALPAPAAQEAGRLRVTVDDTTRATLVFTPATAIDAPLHGWVALLGGNLTPDVPRGENRGRKWRRDFVVLALRTAPLTFAHGRWNATVTLPATPEKPVAVAAWVAAGEARPALQATGGWLR